MSKVALATALGLLLFFTYLTGIRPAYAFAYGLCLLFVIAWIWPRLAIRGVTVTRRVDPGTPTVGALVRALSWVGAGHVTGQAFWFGRVAVEQAQLDTLGHLGEEREVRPRAVEGPAERIGAARPHSHHRHATGPSPPQLTEGSS